MDRETILNEIAVLQGFISKFTLDVRSKREIIEIKEQLNELIHELHILDATYGGKYGEK